MADVPPWPRNITRVHITREHLQAGCTDEMPTAHHAVCLAVKEAVGDPSARVYIRTDYEPAVITCSQQNGITWWYTVPPSDAENLLDTDYDDLSTRQQVKLLKTADMGLLQFDLEWEQGELPEDDSE